MPSSLILTFQSSAVLSQGGLGAEIWDGLHTSTTTMRTQYILCIDVNLYNGQQVKKIWAVRKSSCTERYYYTIGLLHGRSGLHYPALWPWIHKQHFDCVPYYCSILLNTFSDQPINPAPFKARNSYQWISILRWKTLPRGRCEMEQKQQKVVYYYKGESSSSEELSVMLSLPSFLDRTPFE